MKEKITTINVPDDKIQAVFVDEYGKTIRKAVLLAGVTEEDEQGNQRTYVAPLVWDTNTKKYHHCDRFDTFEGLEQGQAMDVSRVANQRREAMAGMNETADEVLESLRPSIEREQRPTNRDVPPQKRNRISEPSEEFSEPLVERVTEKKTRRRLF